MAQSWKDMWLVADSPRKQPVSAGRRDGREGGGLVCKRRCPWKLILGCISISQCKTAQQNPLTAFLMCHRVSLRWGRKWCVGAGQDWFKGVNDCPLGEGEMREWQRGLSETELAVSQSCGIGWSTEKERESRSPPWHSKSLHSVSCLLSGHIILYREICKVNM